MPRYRNALPQLNGKVFLGYFGMETDLIFNRGIDLPGFAAYTLLETEDGRRILEEYCINLISLARRTGAGVILETPSWVANRDRGAAIGYAAERLRELNRESVELVSDMRDKHGDVPTVISCTIGPRADAYAPDSYMSATEAERYHAEQIDWVADTDIDMVGAYTLCYPDEAIGIVRAAQKAGLPATIGFTVETDGKLPNGNALAEAIGTVDSATDNATAYYVINCAHPDHFGNELTDAPWMDRIIGVIANASRRSHAELDEAEELDAGDPVELGGLMGDLRSRFPHLVIVGGCCGTDMRHMESIAESASANTR